MNVPPRGPGQGADEGPPAASPAAGDSPEEDDGEGAAERSRGAAHAAAWTARTILAVREAGDARAVAHRGQQRMVAVRLLALVGVLIWAIVKMNPAGVKPAGRWDMARPAAVSERSHEGAAPAVVDLPAAMDVMDDVAMRGGACPATGVLSVELGPTGLVRARLAGEGDLACLAILVWAAPWPRTQQGILLDQSLAKVVGTSQLGK